MGIHYKAVFRSQDRLSGSTYSEPQFSNLNLPNLSNLQEYQFVKLFVSDALVNADLSGSDMSHICISLVGKSPMNVSRSTGTGTQGSAFLAMVPFDVKETGNAYLYKTVHTDERSYLILPINEVQDTNIQFKLTSGDGQNIKTPTSGSFNGWGFCLTMEPIKTLAGCSCMDK